MQGQHYAHYVNTFQMFLLLSHQFVFEITSTRSPLNELYWHLLAHCHHRFNFYTFSFCIYQGCQTLVSSLLRKITNVVHEVITRHDNIKLFTNTLTKCCSQQTTSSHYKEKIIKCRLINISLYRAWGRLNYLI